MKKVVFTNQVCKREKNSLQNRCQTIGNVSLYGINSIDNDKTERKNIRIHVYTGSPIFKRPNFTQCKIFLQIRNFSWIILEFF